MPEELRPLTVYLSESEVQRLEAEALDAGRSGVSSQIRFILAQRRREQTPRPSRVSR